MATQNNTLGLLFVGVLAFVVGKAIVNAPAPTPSNPSRPPTDQGPMLPPAGKPKPPVLPGPPLKPPGPGDIGPTPFPMDPVAPGKLDPMLGYNDPFTTATWSTSDQPAVGGNPGSTVLIEYDDPWIRKPRYDDVLVEPVQSY